MVVPTLVVINNSTGKIITNCGMEAIEYNQHHNPKLAVEAWKQGNDSIPFYARVATKCMIL